MKTQLPRAERLARQDDLRKGLPAPRSRAENIARVAKAARATVSSGLPQNVTPDQLDRELNGLCLKLCELRAAVDGMDVGVMSSATVDSREHSIMYGHVLTARRLADEVYDYAGEVQAMAQSLARDLRGGVR